MTATPRSRHERMLAQRIQPAADPASWGTPEGRAIIELLWDPPKPSNRGPRQRLTLDRVVDAAIELAAAEGVDRLSMRSLANRLDVGAMSLYTYVPGRDELFELMIDRAWASREKADPALPWRAQIEFHAQQAWDMYAAHPWLIYSNLWRMPLGPHVLDIQEDMFRAVRLTGLPPEDIVRVTGLIDSHVFGVARSKITDTSVSANTGITVDAYWESRMSFWGTYYSPDRFPTTTWIWEQKGFDLPLGEDLAFGLERLLDGVELLVAASQE